MHFPHAIRERYSEDFWRCILLQSKESVVTVETRKGRGNRNRGTGTGKRERGIHGEGMRTDFKFCPKSTLINIESFLLPSEMFLDTSTNNMKSATCLILILFHWNQFIVTDSLCPLHCEAGSREEQGEQQCHTHCLVPESLKQHSLGSCSTLWPRKASPKRQMSTGSTCKGLILQNSAHEPTISVTKFPFH